LTTASIDQVALLALTYRELARFGATGAPSSPSDIFDDLDAIPGEVSLLRLIGSAALPEFDWLIVGALSEPETVPALLADLVEFDPRRAEALLHAAWPSDADSSRVVPVAFLTRWDAVEEAMTELRSIGLTASRGDVFETYVGALERSGRSRAGVLDDYFESTNP
jgi:hypothetical protein